MNRELNAVQPLTDGNLLIYTREERTQNGVEPAMMPFKACLLFPPDPEINKAYPYKQGSRRSSSSTVKIVMNLNTAR
jgi:hypothetical protein